MVIASANKVPLLGQTSTKHTKTHQTPKQICNKTQKKNLTNCQRYGKCAVSQKAVRRRCVRHYTRIVYLMMADGWCVFVFVLWLCGLIRCVAEVCVFRCDEMRSEGVVFVCVWCCVCCWWICLQVSHSCVFVCNDGGWDDFEPLSCLIRIIDTKTISGLGDRYKKGIN